MGQLKITFTDVDKELEKYVRSKTSASAFLKDLAKVEMQRENNYIQNKTIINTITPEIVKIIKEEPVEEPVKENFDFSIDDLA